MSRTRKNKKREARLAKPWIPGGYSKGWITCFCHGRTFPLYSWRGLLK